MKAEIEKALDRVIADDVKREAFRIMSAVWLVPSLNCRAISGKEVHFLAANGRSWRTPLDNALDILGVPEDHELHTLSFTPFRKRWAQYVKETPELARFS